MSIYLLIVRTFMEKQVVKTQKHMQSDVTVQIVSEAWPGRKNIKWTHIAIGNQDQTRAKRVSPNFLEAM